MLTTDFSRKSKPLAATTLWVQGGKHYSFRNQSLWQPSLGTKLWQPECLAASLCLAARLWQPDSVWQPEPGSQFLGNQTCSGSQSVWKPKCLEAKVSNQQFFDDFCWAPGLVLSTCFSCLRVIRFHSCHDLSCSWPCAACGQASAITYGTNFNLTKLLNCPALKVSWRVRQGLVEIGRLLNKATLHVFKYVVGSGRGASLEIMLGANAWYC